MSRYLGLDLGTSSLKSLLITGTGEVLGRASAAYPTTTPAPHRAEQHLADWQGAVAAVVAELVPDGVVDAVGIAGHTPSLACLAPDRREVRPALIWSDLRAEAEAAELARQFGDEVPIVGGRLPWSAAYLPAKLLWLARAGLGSTRWLFQPKDAVNFALTGVAATDPWGSKGLNRIDDGSVVQPLFDHAGVPSEMLPPRHPAWARLGEVDRTGAGWSGLRAGTAVAVGWTDALAGMLGVGGFAEPRAFVLTGTSDIAGTTYPNPAAPSLLHVPESCAPLPVNYGPTQSSGASVLWLARLLGQTPAEVIASALNAQRPDTTTFVPYLAGERAPVWRTDVRAVFSGMSSDTLGPELARAVLRGVAASNRHVLTAAGHRGQPVHIGGASAQAAGWLAARHEMWGVDLVLHREPHTGALGAAILAAAADTDAPVSEISSRFAHDATVVAASTDDAATAATLYRDYQRAAEYAQAR